MELQTEHRNISFSQDASLIRLLEEQVERTPDQIAIITDQGNLTFRQLNEQANQLAHALQAHGIGPDKRVAIALPRTPELLVALWGVLKAGGAYVPLDIADPKSRLNAILDDAHVSAIITETSLQSRLPAEIAPFVTLESVKDQSKLNPNETATSDNLAYVLYTSGTTGQPKGVMIERRSVINLLNGLQTAIYQRFGAETLRVTMTANLSFDASVKQLFQLLSGHTVCLVPEEARRDGAKLLAFLEANEIDVVDCTPSLLEILLYAGLRERKATRRLRFLIGGEPISQALWTTLQAQKDIDFFNLYGPTECTVDTTVAEIHTSSEQTNIGLPIPDATVFVFDTNGQSVPSGVAGELYIGGPRLARGYLNRPELTEQQFIDRAGNRLYKTGDRVRRLTDGTLQFLARLDDQVKLGGYRIELGEIESALSTHPALRSLSVVTRELSENTVRLVAYCVLNEDMSVSDEGLRQFLSNLVPDYMIPSHFVYMDSLPLTANGKVDTRMLPAPEVTRPAQSDTQDAPRDVLESVLAAAWSQALHTDSVGIHDDFFELGGNSIGATQMISHLQSFFITDEPLLSLFFEEPTVAGLALAIRETADDADSIDKIAEILSHASEMTDEELEALLAEA